MANTPNNYLQTIQKGVQQVGQGIPGGVGGLISTGLSLLNNNLQGAQQASAPPDQVPGQQLDAYGKPQYNLGAYSQYAESIDPNEGNNFFTDLGVGSHNRLQSMRKKMLAQANLRSAQKMFNNSMETFNSQQAAQGLYNDTANTDQRQQNLYTYNSNG